MENILSFLLKRESDSMSCTTTSSYSSCLTSPDDSSHEDSVAGSGVVKRRQWAKSSQHNRDSAFSDLGLDLEASWREEAVGSTVLLHHYAQDTWQAPTPRAQTIKQVCLSLRHNRVSLTHILIHLQRPTSNWNA